MGSFSTEYIIYIREQDGSRTMFSAGELRDRLKRCLGDSGTADDITLALEYALLNRQEDSDELVFDRGEIDAAVIRLLEDTGFPEAAEEYRHGEHFEDALLSSEENELTLFFSRHLGCSGEKFEYVKNSVLDAVRKIGIKEASPHLFLELARYFSKQTQEIGGAVLEELPELDVTRLTTLQENVSAAAAGLLADKVITIECVTAIFSCVRFHVSMRSFCSHYDVSSPATELLVIPAAQEVGAAIEECREKLISGTPNADKLPCTLVIHDLYCFVRDAFDCSDDVTAEQLSLELGDAFAGFAGKNLFKLDFD